MIFLGGPNKTEIMFMIFFDIKDCRAGISRFATGNSVLYLRCFRIFMLIYRFLNLKLADILGLQ